jgi:HAD superfamily hydrolase (TIGR01509 family)
MAQVKGILWDNDGVLVNTEHLFYESNREIFADHGIDLTPKHFFDWFLTENLGAWHLLHDKGYTQAETDALRELRNHRYGERLNAEGQLQNPGIEKVLARLSQRVPMGVVTSSKREHFQLIHGKLDLQPYFDFVVTDEDVEESKPSPLPYLLGLEKLGIPAENCLVIEDSPRGLQAACSAGIRCIVLRHPLMQDFGFDGAYRIADTPDQLLEIIEALL